MYFASVLVLDHLISYIVEPGDGIYIYMYRTEMA